MSNLVEGSIVEFGGQRFSVAYVELSGTFSEPWIKEIKLLWVIPDAD